jgi:glycosyltransferase involved in cell wall biosynthesis
MSDIDDFLSKSSIIIVSHVANTGHSQELENFLINKARILVFIGHPFFYAKSTKSFVKVYKKGKIIKKIIVPAFKGPELLFYLKDFLLTFYFIARLRRKFDIYIGADPLNAFVGVILKKLDIVKVVIFYTIDYVPIRFENKLLNWIYHLVDKICVYNSDYTWNLTSAMAEARAKKGIKKEKTKQIVVPTCTHFNRIDHPPIDAINRTSIAFLSHLREGQGIELILDSMPEIVKYVPSVKLIVIGTGPLEKYFKEEAGKKGLKSHIEFLGYIADHKKIEKIISKCAIGVAPYVPNPDSFTWFADPGKPKVYLGCGLPVVITKVPHIAFEIEENKAGIAINYDKEELINAVLKLLMDDKIYMKYRRDAIRFASRYPWDKIFEEALAKCMSR